MHIAHDMIRKRYDVADEQRKNTSKHIMQAQTAKVQLLPHRDCTYVPVLVCVSAPLTEK